MGSASNVRVPFFQNRDALLTGGVVLQAPWVGALKHVADVAHHASDFVGSLTPLGPEGEQEIDSFV